MNKFFSRIRHARGRKRQAFRNLYVRNLLKILRLGSRQSTELNYLLPQSFKTRILSRELVSASHEYSFDTPDGIFRHTFNAAEIVVLSHAIVDTEFNLIYAITNSGNLMFLKESSDWPASHVTQYFRLEKMAKLTEFTDVALGLGSHGYYHMLTEDLPRAITLSEKNTIVQYAESPRYFSEILVGLGCKIIPVPKYISVRNLTFMTHGQDLGYINTWQISSLQNKLKTCDNTLPKDNYYISRASSRRSPSFENTLQVKLEKLGFQVLYLEELNFELQRDQLSSAKTIIGPHGAGLTSALWAHKPNVIELMDSSFFNRCYEWQTLMAGGRYQRIDYSEASANVEDIYKEIIQRLHAI